MLGQIGLQSEKFLSLQNPKIRYTVFSSPLQQFRKESGILIFRADDQGTVSVKREIQLPGQSVHHLIAPDIHLCLLRAGQSVETCVNNGAVGLGGAAADILLPLDHTDGAPISGEFSGDGASHNAGADNYCIVHSYRSFPEKNKSKAGTVSGRPFYLALVSGKLFIYIYSIAGHPADCNE